MKIIHFCFLIALPILCSSQGKDNYDGLIAKSKEYLNDNPQEALKIAKKAFGIAPVDKKGSAYYQIANAFSYLDNLDSVSFYIDLAIEKNRKNGNNKLLSGTLVFKGQNEIFRGNYSATRELFKEAKEIMIAESDTGRLVDLYLRMGGLAIDQDRLKDAIIEVEKCYNLSLASKDNVYAAYALNDLAIIQTKIGNTKKGLEMAFKALELGEKEGDNFTAYQAYNNIGILYKNSKQYSKALQAYSDAEKLGHELKFNRGLMGLYSNRGILYNLMERYQEADLEFEKALTIEKEIGMPMVKADIKINQGNTYMLLGKYALADELVKEGLEIAENIGSLELQLDGHEIAKDIQFSTGNLKGVLLEMEAILAIKDSLFNKEKTKQIHEFQTKYETVKKDAEINDLNRKTEIQQLRNRVLWAGLLLLAISAISIVYSINSKRKRDKLLSEKEQALEIEKRKSAEMELDTKKKELTSKVLQLAKKNDFLLNLEMEVDALKSDVDSSVTKTSRKISKMIKRDIADDRQWEQFSFEFSSIHKGFWEALSEKHGTFSKNEMRLISLMKMNLTSKEIADIIGISADGIKKARYRLRKKINSEDTQLQSYLLNFS